MKNNEKSLPKFKNAMKNIVTDPLGIEKKVIRSISNYLQQVSKEENIPLDKLHIQIGYHNGEITVSIMDTKTLPRKHKHISEFIKFFI